MEHRPRLAISWNGLPQYAARLIRAAIERWGAPVDVIGSRPTMPVAGMEEALGQKIHWLDEDRPSRWSDIGLEPPEIFVQSGWGYSAWNALGREVKARGGRVIGLSDANWRGDLRQLVLGSVIFRSYYRRLFDGMLVPGAQGTRLMRHFGMSPDRVREGLLGADPELFHGGTQLKDRPRTFLYVGQFIARKDVLGVARAFIEFCRERRDWTLVICGDGPQRDLIPRHPNIELRDFVQPEDLAGIFREARFFVLASFVEPWGLVVHEAAASGCALMLSETIGAADDLARPDNSFSFTPGTHWEMVEAFRKAAEADDAWLDRAERSSRALADRFGPARFADELLTLIDLVQKPASS